MQATQEAGQWRSIRIGMPRGWAASRAQPLAFFGTLLYRYRGQENVAFEVFAEAGRDSLQMDFTEDPSFSALVAKLEISASCAPELRGDTRCLVPEELRRLLSIESRGELNRSTLALHFVDCDGKQEIALAYTEDSYDAETILTFARHCERLLKAAIQTPDLPVSQLQMMSEEELHKLVSQPGPAIEMEPATIPDVFEAQVCKTPNAPALRYNGEVVTYRELYERATQMAASLQARSVGLEALVGVYLDDPISVAVAYFSIAMAGGVLVALDPEWPRERLEQVLRDADPQSVITSSERAPDVPCEPARLLIQEMLEAPSEGFRLNKAHLTPENAAYVVFTSGSTGTPKGVVGLHRTVTTIAKVSHPLRKDEVFALSSNLAFGAGVIGLFFSLLQGASVLLVSRALAKDLPDLVRAWERENVTRIVMVPPQLRQLCALGPETTSRLKQVTTVALAGAALAPEMLSTIYELFPNAMIINAYTCLEIGTMATRWETFPGDRNRAPTVGRVLPNIRIYILGPKLNPLPEGMPGEIYVGSADLSRGYLNRPELTRERFLPSPFDDPKIRRLYRTGDLGRILPNGELEYLGRLDNQVKVRGNRIELEEIELTLQKEPEVHQAAVIAIPAGTEPRLVAFVSAKPGGSVSVSSLREHLGRSLPAYMVPSLFIKVDRLPMTRNGKIDRQNLPKVSTNRPELDTPYAPPADEIESALAEIWEAHLGFAGIGRDDHFLEIGGDSMAAVILAAGIEVRFGCQLPMASLFEYPTIRSLAGELRHSVPGIPQNNGLNRSAQRPDGSSS
jgi:amino acid adenylation domain-containing protein